MSVWAAAQPPSTRLMPRAGSNVYMVREIIFFSDALSRGGAEPDKMEGRRYSRKSVPAIGFGPAIVTWMVKSAMPSPFTSPWTV